MQSRYLRLLKLLVGAPICGADRSWRTVVEQVPLGWFQEDFLFEYSKNESYVICRNILSANLLGSIAYLQSDTPGIKITDRILNCSVPDLWKWGFQHIPQFPWLPKGLYRLRPSRRV
jgi:hypothetical protein